MFGSLMILNLFQNFRKPLLLERLSICFGWEWYSRSNIFWAWGTYYVNSILLQTDSLEIISVIRIFWTKYSSIYLKYIRNAFFVKAKQNDKLRLKYSPQLLI